MSFIDVRTLLIIYTVITVLCFLVMFFLWRQNRRHSPEIIYWLTDYAMQFIALVLILLRGRIPDFLSIVAANSLIICGMIVFYIGLEKYVKKTSRHLHLYLAALFFTLLQFYFTTANPSHAMRYINLSAAFLYISLHGSILMLRRTGPEMRNETRATGIVLVFFCIVNISHIIINLSMNVRDDLFEAGLFDAITLLEYQLLFILMTFALILMVSRRLLTKLEVELEERVTAEEELKNSRQRFQSLVETLSDFVWEVDPLGHYTYVSPQIKNILGYDPEEILGKTPAELMDPKEADAVWKAFTELASVKKQVFALENVNIHKDGRRVVLETNGMPFVDAEGSLKGYRGTDRDISARKRAEEALLRSEEKFSRAFQISNVGIVITRIRDGKILEVNDAFASLLGFSRDEIIDNTSLKLNSWVNPEDRKQLMSEIGNGKSVYGREYLLRKRNGEILTVLFSAHAIYLDGELCMLSNINNITDRKMAEEELHKQKRFLSDLIEYNGALVSIKDVDSRYILVNRMWEEKTGLDRKDVIGRTDEELFPGETGRQLRKNDLEVLESGNVIEKEEIIADGIGKRIFLSIKFPLRSDNGAIEGLCGMFNDITERKENEEKIRHLATHDVLTDLPSMRLANDRLAMALSNANRHKNRIAVMFIDLDGFKNINDTSGHNAGDFVLKQVAQRLLGCVRSTDTVARVGGDEFLLVITEIHSFDDAAKIAESVLDSISQPIIFEDRQLKVGASLGIAVYPDHGRDIKRLIKNADEAMYRVKGSGKNNYCFSGVLI